MKVQGSASAGPLPSRSASGCAATKASQRARRPGVVGAPGADVGQRLGQRADERVALGPAFVRDDDAGADAVEPRVVYQHRRDVLRLVAQLGDRPLAGDHDDGRHVAQLGRHRLVEHGLVGRLAPRPLGSGAEHDGVVGLVGPGDVDLVDARVRGQVLPHRGATVDDAQHAGIDERLERAAPVRDEIVVHRVRLHHDDLALDEELGQHVAGAERGDVAGGEDERGARSRHRVGVGGSLAGDEAVAGDARLHPDLGGRLGERDAVEGARREDLHAQAAVGRLAHRPGDGGLAVLGDVAQRVAVEAGHAHERADAGEELLAGFRRARLEALGRVRRSEPLVLRRHGGVDHVLEQSRPGRGVGLRPAGRVVGDEVDVRVQRVGVDGWRRRRGRSVVCRGRGGWVGGRGNRPAARDGHRSSSPARRRTMGPAIGVGAARINKAQRTEACL